MNYIRFLFFFLALQNCVAQTALYNIERSRDSLGSKYSSFISSDSIAVTLKALTSPAMGGRETGQSGQKTAAAFIRNNYLNRKILLGHAQSLPDTTPQSFIQKHPLSIKVNQGRNLSVNGESYLYGRDFIYTPIKNDTSVFLNKILFIAGKYDITHLLSGDRYTTRSIVSFDDEELIGKLSQLDKINSPDVAFLITSTEKIFSLFDNGIEEEVFNFPVFYINEKIAMKMIGDKYEKLTKKGRRKKSTVIKELECNASVGLTRETFLCGQNVIAMLPGVDANGETVIISAHYDHLGKTDSVYFPGADDNASGTSAVIELARLFCKAAEDGFRPRRNIIFLNVSGEEKGLFGSSWLVNHPPLPLKNLIADLNIDMIGRTDSIYDNAGKSDYVYVIGSDRLSVQLDSIIKHQNNISLNLTLDYKYNSEDDPNYFYKRSDHYNFARQGIPVAFFFDGKHADYHLPSDVYEKINFNLLTKRAQLVFLTAWDVANRPSRIVVDKK